MKKIFWMPLAAGVLFVSGCGSNPQTADSDTPASAGNTTVAQSRPSGASVQLPSEPKEVVRLFLDSMRQGNGSQLSALLSTAAREEINRKQLEIDPLGSPMATFQIGEAAAQGDGMLVSTTWSEPEQNGSPAAELEVVWELRKETSGWRICGMAVDPLTGEEIQVVNFERLEQAQPASPEQRVASLPNAQPNVPATGFPAAVNNQPAATQFNPNQNSFPTAQPTGSPAGNLPSNMGAQTNGFAPNGTQPNMPPIVPSSGQLPPVQPGTFALPPAAGNLPPANSQSFGGNNQLPPASTPYLQR